VRTDAKLFRFAVVLFTSKGPLNMRYKEHEHGIPEFAWQTVRARQPHCPARWLLFALHKLAQYADGFSLG